MRKITPRTLKILKKAGLWENQCLLCGTYNQTTAEHALYEAGRQIDDPCAIIPLCDDCNRRAYGTEIKRRAIQCSMMTYDLAYGNRDKLPERYRQYHAELDDLQTGRARRWATKLAKSL